MRFDSSRSLAAGSAQAVAVSSRMIALSPSPGIGIACSGFRRYRRSPCCVSVHAVTPRSTGRPERRTHPRPRAAVGGVAVVRGQHAGSCPRPRRVYCNLGGVGLFAVPVGALNAHGHGVVFLQAAFRGIVVRAQLLRASRPSARRHPCRRCPSSLPPCVPQPASKLPRRKARQCLLSSSFSS